MVAFVEIEARRGGGVLESVAEKTN